MSRACGHRRGFVLIAVLVIVGSALLITTSVLFTTSAENAGAAAATGNVQSRALAWSGLQAVMVRLGEQRSSILQGEYPRVDSQVVVYQAGRRAGVVRLLPVGPRGERISAEAGKLDLNRADAESLIATGMVDSALAEAIIRFRDEQLGRPFQSVEELLLAPGMTPALFSGGVEDMLPGSASAASIGAHAGGASPLERARGLADVLTVYAFEPALQSSGQGRICLNVPWSEELGQRVDERFGAGESALLKRVYDSGVKFDSDAKIFEVMRTFKVQPQAWPDILDTFTTDASECHFGRVDINAAPVEVLQALPGVEPEEAARLVQARELLSPRDRATIAWPVLQGILKPDSYDGLAGRLTTRCWTYRVRILAGEVDREYLEGAMENPLIYEAVIDISSARPRLAYLRDISLLSTALALATSLELEHEQASVGHRDPRTAESGESATELTPEEQPNDDSAEDSAIASSMDSRAPSERGLAREPSGDPGSAKSGKPGDPADGTDAPAPVAAPAAGSRLGRWRSGG